MMLIGYITASVLLLCAVHTAKLPTYLTKCDHHANWKKCLVENVVKALPEIRDHGDKTIKLRQLNPLVVKRISLEATPTLQAHLYDAKVYGLDKIEMIDMDMDVEKKKFYMKFTVDNMQMIGTYEIDGQILVFPIHGRGHANITSLNSITEYAADLEVIQKGKSQYFKAIPKYTSVVPGKHYYALDNLFNGNERLGKEMNDFINENGDQIFQESKSAIDEVVGSLLTSIINSYISNIPVSELYS